MIPNRHFLQKAMDYYPNRTKIGGYWLSPLYEGVRCFWDGGVSRNFATEQIPWASVIDPMTGQMKDILKPIATGLWTKYADPVVVPDQFLDLLPTFPCDGVLTLGPNCKDEVKSLVSGIKPNDKVLGRSVQYRVFASPRFEDVFSDGRVMTPHLRLEISWENIKKFLQENNTHVDEATLPTLQAQYFAIQAWEGWDERICLAEQIVLSRNHTIAKVMMQSASRHYKKRGHPATIIRSPDSTWLPAVSYNYLRYRNTK